MSDVTALVTVWMFSLSQEPRKDPARFPEGMGNYLVV